VRIYFLDLSYEHRFKVVFVDIPSLVSSGSNRPYADFVESFLGLIPYFSLPWHRVFESTCLSNDPYDPEP
jgi:hypothetical protein